jgi:hypothetical protein
MNKTRRKQLTDKYPALTASRPMSPALNTSVQAMLDTERIIHGAHDIDNEALFDPVWSPVMWERANEAMSELRCGLADGTIAIDSHDYDFNDVEAVEDYDLVVWRVGAKQAHIGHPNHMTERATKRVDYFTGALQLSQEVYDYYECGCRKPCDLTCNVQISKHCNGATRLLAVHRGKYALLFRCCVMCEDLAAAMADTNFRVSLLEVQAKLPDGAVIDPMSPVPPKP